MVTMGALRPQHCWIAFPRACSFRRYDHAKLLHTYAHTHTHIHTDIWNHPILYPTPRLLAAVGITTSWTYITVQKIMLTRGWALNSVHNSCQPLNLLHFVTLWPKWVTRTHDGLSLWQVWWFVVSAVWFIMRTNRHTDRITNRQTIGISK